MATPTSNRPRIARKGIESSTTLGKHRWVIERTIAWLFGYRRLTIRYERHAHLFCAFLALAVPTCYKNLLQKTRQAKRDTLLVFSSLCSSESQVNARTAPWLGLAGHTVHYGVDQLGCFARPASTMSDSFQVALCTCGKLTSGSAPELCEWPRVVSPAPRGAVVGPWDLSSICDVLSSARETLRPAALGASRAGNLAPPRGNTRVDPGRHRPFAQPHPNWETLPSTGQETGPSNDLFYELTLARKPLLLEPAPEVTAVTDHPSPGGSSVIQASRC
jgi:hypothetical protein